MGMLASPLVDGVPTKTSKANSSAHTTLSTSLPPCPVPLLLPTLPYYLTGFALHTDLTLPRELPLL